MARQNKIVISPSKIIPKSRQSTSDVGLKQVASLLENTDVERASAGAFSKIRRRTGLVLGLNACNDVSGLLVWAICSSLEAGTSE